MRAFLAAMVLVITLGACVATPQTQEQQLAAVELTFTGLVEQLVEARTTGLIADDELWSCIQVTALAIDRGLDTTRRYLDRNASIAILIGTIQAQIRTLRRLEATGENICGNNRGIPSSHRHRIDRPDFGYGVQFHSNQDAG